MTPWSYESAAKYYILKMQYYKFIIVSRNPNIKPGCIRMGLGYSRSENFIPFFRIQHHISLKVNYKESILSHLHYRYDFTGKMSHFKNFFL